jgi:septum formation protein
MAVVPPVLVLASASPRRRALLASLGLTVQVDPPEVDESVQPGEPPDRYVLRLARSKADAVARRHPGQLVLGADTEVVQEGRVLGKPRSTEDAVRMLAGLAGRTHAVLTAVALAGTVSTERVVRAEVTFARSSPEALRWYVATGEPMDKAGAYGVQGIGGFLVERVVGSPTAVVGLPLAETVALLEEAGFPLPWVHG